MYLKKNNKKNQKSSQANGKPGSPVSEKAPGEGVLKEENAP